MQKILAVIAVCSLAALPLLVRADVAVKIELPEPAVTAVQAEAQACSAVAVGLPVENFGLPVLQPRFGLPHCSVYQGNSCSGGWVMCQWQPGEPEICICTSGTWQCG